MMPTLSKPLNIKTLSEVTGLQRYEITVLLKEHRIPRIETINQTIVLPEGLPRLIEVLLNYPGVDPGFAERL